MAVKAAAMAAAERESRPKLVPTVQRRSTVSRRPPGKSALGKNAFEGRM